MKLVKISEDGLRRETPARLGCGHSYVYFHTLATSVRTTSLAREHLLFFHREASKIVLPENWRTLYSIYSLEFEIAKKLRPFPAPEAGIIFSFFVNRVDSQKSWCASGGC